MTGSTVSLNSTARPLAPVAEVLELTGYGERLEKPS